MPPRIVHSLLLSLTLLITPLGLLGCGGGAAGGSPAAARLLTQTFTGSHRVDSGELSFSLTVVPTGSSTLKGPISLSFGGPFQSRGLGQVPKSDFTVSLAADGGHIGLGVLSTGTAGYVSLNGSSYRLPAADFQRLAASFGSLAPSGGSGGGGALARLGIRPLRWLSHPTVVGADTVAGAATTHVRAGIDVPALLADLPALLSQASALGVSGAGQLSAALSPAGRRRIAAEIRGPGVDVWTGASDRTIRRLRIQLTLPVRGALSAGLGGLSSAQLVATLQYAQLNQPQTIAAPASVRPYSEFSGQLRSLVGALRSNFAGG